MASWVSVASWAMAASERVGRHRLEGQVVPLVVPDADGIVVMAHPPG